MINRRAFMKSGALALFAAGLGGVPPFIARAAHQYRLWTPYQRNKTLVCIFQRGAMDGLMAVSPFADPHLKALRPTLYMEPGTDKNSLTDLDGYFGLHPSLNSLLPFFKERRMAIAHGVGSPNTTRSHFDAQDFMESGTPFKKGTASGWLNRAVALSPHTPTPFSAVSMTTALPRSLYGDREALAIGNLQDFVLRSGNDMVRPNLANRSFESLYDETRNRLLSRTGKESFEAIKMLQGADIKNYQPAAGVVYPNTALGNALRQIAILIKMDVGLEVAFAESGGWDTHFSQGTSNGSFARNLRDLSDSIAAFWNDMGQYQDDVTVMTMTEFGRTVHQNGTGGTDHGRASCSFLLGNDVAGGKVYHQMKTLAKETLEDGRDLPVTTDFRAVFSAVAQKHLQLKKNKELFPGWNGIPLSIMR